MVCDLITITSFDAVVMQKYFTLVLRERLEYYWTNLRVSNIHVICSMQFEKLDSDLKNYKSNSIKESIR